MSVLKDLGRATKDLTQALLSRSDPPKRWLEEATDISCQTQDRGASARSERSPSPHSTPHSATWTKGKQGNTRTPKKLQRRKSQLRFLEQEPGPVNFDVVFVMAMPSDADGGAKELSSDEVKPKGAAMTNHKDTEAIMRALGLKIPRAPSCLQKCMRRLCGTAIEEDPEKQFQELDMGKELRRKVLDTARTTSSKTHMKAHLDEKLKENPAKDAKNVRQVLLELLLSLLSNDKFFNVALFKSVDGDEVFVCVSATDSLLCEHASFYSYPLELSRQAVLQDLQIPYMPTYSETASVKYNKGAKSYLKRYKLSPCEEPTIFKSSDRIRLLNNIIESQVDFSRWTELGFMITSYYPHHSQFLTRLRWTWAHPRQAAKHRDRLAKEIANQRSYNQMRDAFHDQEDFITAARRMMTQWKSERNRQTSPQKVHDEVRDYFGERIAFYFVFLRHTCAYLYVLTAVAVLVTIYELFLMTPRITFSEVLLGTGFDSTARAAFGCFIAVWAAGFAQGWRRNEANLKVRWGETRCESGWYRKNTHDDSVKKVAAAKTAGSDSPGQQEAEKVEEELDPDTLQDERSEEELIIAFVERVFRRTLSWLVTALFVVFVCYLTYLVMKLKTDLTKDHPVKAKLTSLLLSLQMQVWMNVWPYVAYWLTKKERWQLERDFVDSHAIKIFVIDFVCAFAGMYYAAFIQEYLENGTIGSFGMTCTSGDCKSNYMTVLVINMEVIFGIYILFTLFDIVLPFLGLELRMINEAREFKKQTGRLHRISFLESQAKFDEYDGMCESYDYEQIVLPLAFVMLFGCVMPLATILALITVVGQARVDSWKLVNAYRRPYPSFGEGIGGWRVNMLIGLAYVSGFTNIGLIVVRLRLVGKHSKDAGSLDINDLFFVIVLEHILVVGIWLMQAVMPADPDWLLVEHQRQHMQRQRVNHLVANHTPRIERRDRAGSRETDDPVSRVSSSPETSGSSKHRFSFDGDVRRESLAEYSHLHQEEKSFDDLPGLCEEEECFEPMLI